MKTNPNLQVPQRKKANKSQDSGLKSVFCRRSTVRKEGRNDGNLPQKKARLSPMEKKRGKKKTIGVWFTKDSLKRVSYTRAREWTELTTQSVCFFSEKHLPT